MSDIGFPIRLRLLRLGNGWSQRDLAAKAGLSQACISHFETGRREPGTRVALKLVRVLKVDLSDLIPADW